jgi:hypothetical protein
VEAVPQELRDDPDDRRNDDVTVSRLLRHSAGGKNMSIAAKHYLGRSDLYLRTVVDEAFEPYGAILAPKGAAVVSPRMLKTGVTA